MHLLEKHIYGMVAQLKIVAAVCISAKNKSEIIVMGKMQIQRFGWGAASPMNLERYTK